MSSLITLVVIYLQEQESFYRWDRYELVNYFIAFRICSALILVFISFGVKKRSTIPTISWAKVIPGTAWGTLPCLMWRSLVQMLPNVTLTMASVGSMSVDYGFSKPLLFAKVQIKSRTNKKIDFFRRYVFFLNVRLYLQMFIYE